MSDTEQHAGSPPPKIGIPTEVSDEQGPAPVVPGISPYTSNTAVVNEVVEGDRKIREKSGSVIPSPGEQNSAIVAGRGVKTFPIPVEPAPSPIPTNSPAKFSITVTDTPKQDGWETGKQGIVFVCVSTGDPYPSNEDYIKGCTAGDKMVECLGTKLGYHIVRVGTNWNMRSGELDELLTKIKQSKLPESYRRAVFYFFGHGNASQVKTADGYYERRGIVERFQSICPPELDVFKIIIFECCRRDRPITCEPVPETGPTQTLSVDDCSKDGGAYPVAKNTLVIDATNFDNVAHYLTRNGCGLFTGHFTELAPIKNASFDELLVQVREKVVAETTRNMFPEQLVDFKNMLMGSIHLLAESQGTARVTATRVIVKPTALTTTIEWQLQGKVPEDLLRFDVEISPGTPHAQVSKVDTSTRYATFAATRLGSAMEHSVRVVAVYEDDTRATSDSETKSFTTPEVSLAKIQSPLTVTGFREGDTLKAVYTVPLSYEPPPNSQLKKDHFTVTATPTTPDPERGGEDTVTMSCKERSIKLELELGSTYSLSVSTCYTDLEGNNSCNFPSKQEVIFITTPKEDKVRPKFLEAEPQQTKADITFLYPLIPEGLRVTHITVEPCDGEDGTSRSKQKTKSVEFKQPCSPSSSRGSPAPLADQQHHRVKISKLEAERRHSMKLRAEYNTGDYVDSETFIIETRPYTGCHKGFCCFGYVTVYSLLSLLLLGSLFLCGSYTAYTVVLHRNPQCVTNYILTYDSVECGSANALQYDRITVQGTPKDGDTLLGVMHAWLREEDNLNFYSELRNPVIDGGPVTDHEQVFLNGYQTYTWKGSVIYGYCCITNNGSTEQTASLFIFTNDSDVLNFFHGLGASNTVLSDTLTIPPGRQECFKKWGTDAPYTVTHNSYHFIGVDVPANSIYSSNITVRQVSVNTTNYGPPHYFKYNNGTEFLLSKRHFWDKDCVIVCKAPSDTPEANPLNVSQSESEVESISIAARVGDESVHINSCKVPHDWKTEAKWTLIAGVVLFLVILTLFIGTCCCMCKCHRKQLFLFNASCKWRARHGSYTTLPDQDAPN